MANQIPITVTGSLVVSGSMESTGSISDVTASYIAGTDVDGAVALADTGSYVAGANVDGVVASATAAVSASHALQADAADAAATAVSASHALKTDLADVASAVDYDNVLNKPSLISQSMDATLGALTASDGYFSGDINVHGTGSFSVFKTQYVTSSIIEASGSTKFGDDIGDVHQRTGSLEVVGGITGSLQGDGAQVTGIGSASHALQADNALAAATAATADVALEGSGSFTGSFVGGVELTENQAIESVQVVHNRLDLGVQSADFTMSFDQGNVQRFAAGDDLNFDISNLNPGGVYIAEIENTGSFTINLPTGMLWHEGTNVPSASIGIDSLDVYGFYRAGSQTIAYTIARSASL